MGLAHLTQRRQTVIRGRRPGGVTGTASAVVAGVVATVSLALAVTAVVLRPRRVVVEGRSMEPTLAPGDRLLVVRARRVHAGDVVAVRDPRGARRVLVKRVSAVLDDEIVVRGDNPSASTDSRSFGPVPASAVLGRVVRCYAPPWSAGPVR
jgi:nickel-type superoxide dismutase maturation protease